MSDDRDEFLPLHVDCDEAHGIRTSAERGEEVGVLCSADEGAPIPEGADLVRVRGVRSNGALELETIYSRRGPAKASSPKYRAGFDRVFGPKKDLN